MAEPEDEVPSLLLPCTICNRTFKPESLEKHTKVCEKNATKKRRTFDSSKQRIQGTELAEFLPVVQKKVEKSPVKKTPSTWKEKHMEFVRAIRQARGAEVPGKRSLSAVGQSRPSNHEKCPHCERNFGPKAFDRHVEWCKEQKTRIPKSPASMLAKERLEARTKYRAPLSKSKRTIMREKYSPVHRASTAREPSPMASRSTANCSNMSVNSSSLNHTTPMPIIRTATRTSGSTPSSQRSSARESLSSPTCGAQRNSTSRSSTQRRTSSPTKKLSLNRKDSSGGRGESTPQPQKKKSANDNVGDLFSSSCNITRLNPTGKNTSKNVPVPTSVVNVARNRNNKKNEVKSNRSLSSPHSNATPREVKKCAMSRIDEQSESENNPLHALSLEGSQTSLSTDTPRAPITNRRKNKGKVKTLKTCDEEIIPSVEKLELRKEKTFLKREGSYISDKASARSSTSTNKEMMLSETFRNATGKEESRKKQWQYLDISPKKINILDRNIHACRRPNKINDTDINMNQVELTVSPCHIYPPKNNFVTWQDLANSSVSELELENDLNKTYIITEDAIEERADILRLDLSAQNSGYSLSQETGSPDAETGRQDSEQEKNSSGSYSDSLVDHALADDEGAESEKASNQSFEFDHEDIRVEQCIESESEDTISSRQNVEDEPRQMFKGDENLEYHLKESVKDNQNTEFQCKDFIRTESQLKETVKTCQEVKIIPKEIVKINDKIEQKPEEIVSTKENIEHVLQEIQNEENIEYDSEELQRTEQDKCGNKEISETKKLTAKDKENARSQSEDSFITTADPDHFTSEDDIVLVTQGARDLNCRIDDEDYMCSTIWDAATKGCLRDRSCSIDSDTFYEGLNQAHLFSTPVKSGVQISEVHSSGDESLDTKQQYRKELAGEKRCKQNRKDETKNSMNNFRLRLLKRRSWSEQFCVKQKLLAFIRPLKAPDVKMRQDNLLQGQPMPKKRRLIETNITWSLFLVEPFWFSRADKDIPVVFQTVRPKQQNFERKSKSEQSLIPRLETNKRQNRPILHRKKCSTGKNIKTLDKIDDSIEICVSENSPKNVSNNTANSITVKYFNKMISPNDVSSENIISLDKFPPIHTDSSVTKVSSLSSDSSARSKLSDRQYNTVSDINVAKLKDVDQQSVRTRSLPMISPELSVFESEKSRGSLDLHTSPSPRKHKKPQQKLTLPKISTPLDNRAKKKSEKDVLCLSTSLKHEQDQINVEEGPDGVYCSISLQEINQDSFELEETAPSQNKLKLPEINIGNEERNNKSSRNIKAVGKRRGKANFWEEQLKNSQSTIREEPSVESQRGIYSRNPNAKKLPPLSHSSPKSVTAEESYDPYKSAERQMMELLSNADWPEPTVERKYSEPLRKKEIKSPVAQKKFSQPICSPSPPQQSELRTSPTSAFSKYPSKPRSESPAPVRPDSPEPKLPATSSQNYEDPEDAVRLQPRKKLDMGKSSAMSLHVEDEPDSHCNRRSIGSKISGDSAYSSLNRKSPLAEVNSQGLERHSEAVLDADVRCLSSSGSESSLPPLCSGQVDRHGGKSPLVMSTPTPLLQSRADSPKMSKFCHECGFKYPVTLAKFCCECGVRRLFV